MFHSAQFLNGLLILLPTIALCDGANQTYEIDCNNLRMGQYICPHPDYDFIDHNTQQPRGCTKENKAKDVERWRKNVESAIKKQVYCSFHSLCKSWLRMLPLVALLFCIITFGDNYSTRARESLRELYYFNKTKHRFFLLVLCLVADGLICTETKNNTFKKDIPCKWTNGYSFETSLLLSIFLGMFGADRFYLGYPALGLLKLSTLGFLFLGQFADVILIATQIVGPADGSHYVMPYYGAGINIVTSNNFTYRVPQYEY